MKNKAKTKTWIKRIHSSDKRADLSYTISDSSPNKDYVMKNSQVEIDLRGKESESKTSIKSGDIIYIAANGFYKKKGDYSLRIVAKGVVDLIEYRNGIPIAVFVQGSFEHLTAPMINGLDVKDVNRNFREYERCQQSPYWEITVDEANYIDQNIFSGSGVKSI
jgi:hypothetical protein